VNSESLADDCERMAIGVEVGGGSEFVVRPAIVRSAGERPTRGVTEDGGAADAESCGDVTDEIACGVSGEELNDLGGLQAPLHLPEGLKAAPLGPLRDPLWPLGSGPSLRCASPPRRAGPPGTCGPELSLEELDLDVEGPIGLGCALIAADERQPVVGRRSGHECLVDRTATDTPHRELTGQR
jgi:hypothetical protein